MNAVNAVESIMVACGGCTIKNCNQTARDDLLYRDWSATKRAKVGLLKKVLVKERRCILAALLERNTIRGQRL